MDRRGNLVVDPSFVERVFHLKQRSNLANHSMYAYQAGLQHAAVNPQWTGERGGRKEWKGEWDGGDGEAGGSAPLPVLSVLECLQDDSAEERARAASSRKSPAPTPQTPPTAAPDVAQQAVEVAVG